MIEKASPCVLDNIAVGSPVWRARLRSFRGFGWAAAATRDPRAPRAGRHLGRWLAGFLAVTTLAVAADLPDWPAVQQEALSHLRELVKLDTSQPAGNEILAARYLAGLLDREGIPYQIIESAPGRASLIARLASGGGGRPLLLLGHLDVVTVERENWTFDPFSATVKDGRIFGRGTADDKGVVTGAFETLLLLKRLKVSLDRDVIFLGVADEENGGTLGITYLLEKHRDLIDAGFAINEGGGGELNRGTGRYLQFQIGTAEKTPRRARLVAKGRAGHGSVPTKDNPVGVLARAVARLFDHPLPVRLNETTRTYFERLRDHANEHDRAVFDEILGADPSEEAQDALRRINERYYSMLRTSVVPTVIQGGYQKNVIPSEAEATLDIRALPDEDPEELFAALKQIAAEPAVDIVPLPVTRPSHQPAPIDGPVFRAFEKVIGRLHPDALVLPAMGTGASDSAQLRAAGIPSYGFGPGRYQDERSGAHGNDESLSVEPFDDYLRILWEVTLELAATR